MQSAGGETHMTYKEMLRELGMLSLEKRKMCVYGGNLAAVCLC